VAGQVRVRLAPNTATPVQLVATGDRSRRTATATIGVVSYTPVIALSSYAALAGQRVQVQGHGFAPGETVRLTVGSAAAAQAQADAGGAVELAYSIPYTVRTGFLGLAARGAASGRPAATRLYVVPLRPWATASAYAVHAGQQVQLAVHGFAAHEMIVVREETAPGHLATARTDDGGNATLGPLTVPPHEQHPTYAVAGARSGAHATVTLTALP
jgi:hypothetical protein